MPAKNNRWYNMWKDQESALSRESDPSYKAQFAKEMLILLGDVSGKSVLEFGCGDGLMFESYGFDKSDYLGVDFSDNLLKKFQLKYPHLNIQKSLAEDFIIDQKFDLIFSCGMIQYLKPGLLDKHLKNIRKMIKKNGRVLLTSIPWKSAKPSYLRRDFGKQNSTVKFLLAWIKRLFYDNIGYWYDMRTLKKLSQKNGFNCTFYGSLHYPYRIHVELKSA